MKSLKKFSLWLIHIFFQIFIFRLFSETQILNTLPVNLNLIMNQSKIKILNKLIKVDPELVYFFLLTQLSDLERINKLFWPVSFKEKWMLKDSFEINGKRSFSDMNAHVGNSIYTRMALMQLNTVNGFWFNYRKRTSLPSMFARSKLKYCTNGRKSRVVIKCG